MSSTFNGFRTWEKTSGGNLALDQFDYRYDRLGNRLSRDIPNTVNSLNDQDYTMSYDGLNRLQEYREGGLANNIAITSLKQQQQWELDNLGNWLNLKEDANGNSASSVSISQSPQGSPEDHLLGWRRVSDLVQAT